MGMSNRYKRLLVPLDGSKLAEVAIPDAVALAEATGAELTLLHVVSSISDIVQTDGYPLHVDEQYESRRAQALEYLDVVRHRLGARNVALHVAVEMGSPADVILEYVRGHAIDLVVMATHGRSGVKRWVFGSVADKVLRGASGLVLLVPAARPAVPA
jgi:nucleotide-binding universal stress UspA family protein